MYVLSIVKPQKKPIKKLPNCQEYLIKKKSIDSVIIILLITIKYAT